MKPNFDESDEDAAKRDLSPLERLTQQQAPYFNLAIIETMAEAVSEGEDAASLAKSLSAVMHITLCTFGSLTHPDKHLNKTFVKTVSTAVRDKVEDLAESLGRDQAELKKEQKQAYLAEVLKQVLDHVFDELNEDIQDKSGSITPAAARMALEVLNSSFRPYASVIKAADLSLTARTELAAVVLAHALLAEADSRTAAKDCDELVFGLLYRTLNIQTPNYKAFLRSDLPPGRLALLGYCLAHNHGDPKVVADDLLDQLETMVLNDKRPSCVAESQVALFYPFLAAATTEHVQGRILPQIQFIMNRTKAFMGVIARLLSGLKTYKIEDLATLKSWTTELLPENLLNSPEETQAKGVRDYLVAVHGICSGKHGVKKSLLNEVFAEQYKQTLRGPIQLKADARRAILGHLAAVASLESPAGEGLSADTLQVALEQFLNCKDEGELTGTLRSVSTLLCLLPEPQSIELLVKVLEKAPRLSQVQHV